ncbi:MAG: serine dehydratase subunit alpha family protein [Lachnospiraceae bacterium]|nr:serine dehydratase subunit alpha family protein [Lachnospiraceae bacterium]
MEHTLYQSYVNILKEELVPAMGCTEPIAVAYAAAIARDTLGALPERVELTVSGNIVKNVKSVVVPNTGGLKGIAASAAAGIVAGNAKKELEVIADVTPEQITQISDYLNHTEFTISESQSGCIFDIGIRIIAGEHTSYTRISGYHTNVIRIEKDGKVLVDKEDESTTENHATDRNLLTVEQIVAFAEAANLDDVRDILKRQIDYNTAIAEEGLEHAYGAQIGRILLRSYGNTVHNRAKAMAAAGSDARMNGCELPVVINSGSGNQGITASLPVIVYAKELQVSEEMLYRALIIANLVTIHLKTGIGRLSAYCGATSAGCGAGAGITYLYGGRYREIAHTIVNAIAINSGVICDGAKASCAAKIASSVEAGLLGMQMYLHGTQFYDGEGIVTKGVENTIRNVGTLAREGMRETDQEIIHMMIQKI